MVDSTQIRSLVDDFQRLTNINVTVFEPDGNIVATPIKENICSRFHHIYIDSCRKCIEPDRETFANVDPATLNIFKCPHDLWNMVSPIIVKDKTCGYLIIGPCILENPDEIRANLLENACNCGFDGEEYRKQLELLPCWNQERVKAAIDFCTGIANLIAGLYLTSISLSKALEEKIAAEEEQKRLQKQIIQASKMESISRLAGGVAHDFNNMLSLICGHTELSRGMIEANDPMIVHLDGVMKAANRATDLTRQLLAFASRQAVLPRPCEVNQIVSLFCNMTSRLMEDRITMNWQSCTEPCTVLADPAQLDKLLSSLVTHARNSIEGKGNIDISVSKTELKEDFEHFTADSEPGTYVRISIKDNGKGMDEEAKKNIFEPFFSTKSMGRGNGLGLAVVYGIVSQNKGIIEVQSSPDSGTEFIVYLPENEAIAEEIVKVKKLAIEKGNGEMILLVEDEKPLLEMAKSMLNRLNYKVMAYNDPVEAVNEIKTSDVDIDLLLTDVVMPGMNGLQLSEAIKDLRQNIKVIFMSGYTANVIESHGILKENVSFIQKPFTLSVLSRETRTVLDGNKINN